MLERIKENDPDSAAFAERILIRRRIERVNRILRNLVLSTDIDNTEIDTITSSVDVFNRNYGENKKVTDVVTSNEMSKWFLKYHPIDYDQVDDLHWRSAEVIADAGPQAGAVDLMSFLNREGISLYRITSRPGTLRHMTVEWYRRWMPWVKPEQIQMQSGLNSENINPLFKRNRIKELGVSIHFDDSLEHARDIIENTNAFVVLLPQPWNGYLVKSDNPKLIGCEKYQEEPLLKRAYLNLVNFIDKNPGKF